MAESLILSPTAQPQVFLGPDGARYTPPADWECLPPGDAALTRRVKLAGPSWAVVEKRGRKVFSKGLWAPRANIAAARDALTSERGTEAYAKKRQADVSRRARAQEGYVQSFEEQLLRLLAFAPRYADLARDLAARVTRHATPVGSGTVARTERIPLAQRAEAAVIAWMRHQTTAYDDMSIARIKGERRRVRRMLAERSKSLLDAYRGNRPLPAACPLRSALARVAA